MSSESVDTPHVELKPAGDAPARTIPRSLLESMPQYVDGSLAGKGSSSIYHRSLWHAVAVVLSQAGVRPPHFKPSRRRSGTW